MSKKSEIIPNLFPINIDDDYKELKKVKKGKPKFASISKMRQGIRHRIKMEKKLLKEFYDELEKLDKDKYESLEIVPVYPKTEKDILGLSKEEIKFLIYKDAIRVWLKPIDVIKLNISCQYRNIKIHDFVHSIIERFFGRGSNFN